MSRSRGGRASVPLIRLTVVADSSGAEAGEPLPIPGQPDPWSVMAECQVPRLLPRIDSGLLP